MGCNDIGAENIGGENHNSWQCRDLIPLQNWKLRIYSKKIWKYSYQTYQTYQKAQLNSSLIHSNIYFLKKQIFGCFRNIYPMKNWNYIYNFRKKTMPWIKVSFWPDQTLAINGYVQCTWSMYFIWLIIKLGKGWTKWMKKNWWTKTCDK